MSKTSVSQFLQPVHDRINSQVTFDPTNPEHVVAFELLFLHGKQTHIRFKLERPYLTIRDMMLAKVGREFIANRFQH